MTRFLQREYRFLFTPLNGKSRLFLVLGALCVAASFFWPLWQIRLVAVQYPEGLTMEIYSHKLVGGNRGHDIHEINLLNHYIGMKPIAEADFVEMRWIPFALGLFILLSLRSAVLGLMSSLIDVLSLFTYFGLFSLGTFYYRLYTYGHQLDPKAPIKIEPFTPPIIGSNKLANFTEHSYPQEASYCLLAFFVCLLLAIWFSRKETWTPGSIV